MITAKQFENLCHKLIKHRKTRGELIHIESGAPINGVYLPMGETYAKIEIGDKTISYGDFREFEKDFETPATVAKAFGAKRVLTLAEIEGHKPTWDEINEELEDMFRDPIEATKEVVKNVTNIFDKLGTRIPDNCLHKRCPDCGGTGIKIDGEMCIHSISCLCSNCTPR